MLHAGLTLRFLIDGAPDAGKRTVFEQLATHGNGIRRSTESDDERTGLPWLEYFTGRFEGNSICLHATRTSGGLDVDERLRRRVWADVIIFVVESTPAGIAHARQSLAVLQADLEFINATVRPELVLLASKQDLPGAIPVDDVATELQLDPNVARSANSAGQSGVVFCMAKAANVALRRLARCDAAGLPRHSSLDPAQTIAAIATQRPVHSGNEEVLATVVSVQPEVDVQNFENVSDIENLSEQQNPPATDSQHHLEHLAEQQRLRDEQKLRDQQRLQNLRELENLRDLKILRDQQNLQNLQRTEPFERPPAPDTRLPAPPTARWQALGRLISILRN